jgi:hypothetical protein
MWIGLPFTSFEEEARQFDPRVMLAGVASCAVCLLVLTVAFASFLVHCDFLQKGHRSPPSEATKKPSGSRTSAERCPHIAWVENILADRKARLCSKLLKGLIAVNLTRRYTPTSNESVVLQIVAEELS